MITFSPVSSYSTTLISLTSLIDRSLVITTRSHHSPSVIWGYQLLRHNLRLSKRRMRSEGWRLELILLSIWRMIFISLISKESTRPPMVCHTSIRPHHQSEPPLMPSFIEPPHFEQSPYFEHTRHYSPFPNPHYSSPPKHPSLHKLHVGFHALREDLHGMRDDITGLHMMFEESSNLYGAQFSSLYHHHFELTTTLD